MSYVFVKYFHLLGVLVIFAAIVLEHVLVKPKMSPADLKKVAVVDIVYGISAGVVLLAGLSLWYLVGKPSEFYSSNPIFLTKVGLFILVGIISIYPTVFFIKNRRLTSSIIVVPKAIVMAIRAELAIVLVLPLLAVLMAQGYGLA